MKKKPIDRTLQKIIVSALSVIVLATSQLYIWGWVEDLAATFHDQRTIEQQIVNLKDQLGELEKNAATQVQVDNQIDTVTIQQDEISQAIERLEQKAQDLQLQLSTNSIITEPANGSSNFSPLVITVTAQGPIEQLLRYMESIEYLTEVTSIRDFSLTINPRPSPTVQAIHTLSLNIVFLTDKLDDGTKKDDKKNFVSNANPGAPDGGVVNVGFYVLLSSAIMLVIAFVYKIRQRKKA